MSLNKVNANERPSRLNRFRQTLGRLFASVMGYSFGLLILINLMPTESKLFKDIQSPFYSTLTRLGFRQEWNMFIGIPVVCDREYTLEARYEDGTIEEFGPLLPGLDEFNESSFRYRTVFRRMRKAKYKSYLTKYYENAKAEVEQAVAKPVINVRLKSKNIRTRWLSDIRNGKGRYRESYRYLKSESNKNSSVARR